ncbi:MAG TPA: hypothetical protein PLZ43_00525 [bacterium]|nr:hypothetical protein [bacterium]
MSKILSLLFVFLFLLLSVACGVEDEDNNNDYEIIADEQYLPDDEKDEETDKISDTDTAQEVPQSARVIAQLSWDKGCKTQTAWDNGGGIRVDLDIHMIKKTSLEAPIYGYKPLEGVLGTFALPFSEIEYHDSANPQNFKYFRHDDCSIFDSGHGQNGDMMIAWHASLDLDNKWGGNNFKTPETISLGPIEDKDGDGIPDDEIMDDQYLIVVNYFDCTSDYEDRIDRCHSDYFGEDSANEVNARVQIFVDGEEVPRGSGDNIYSDRYSATTKDFKIKWGEWKVIAVIKWDSTLPGYEKNPKAYQGNAVVTDVAVPYLGIETDAKSYKTCRLPSNEAVLVPIWNKDDYYAFIERPANEYDPNSPPVGECY